MKVTRQSLSGRCTRSSSVSMDLRAGFALFGGPLRKHWRWQPYSRSSSHGKKSLASALRELFPMDLSAKLAAVQRARSPKC
jgi:hypothetical protein